jgi:antitoxin VapB
MALNIKNPEVEQLAAQAAQLAHESKTEAIRIALQERVARLKMSRRGLSREERVESLLGRFRKQFPRADFGRKLTKVEEEKILGFGPDGV